MKGDKDLDVCPAYRRQTLVVGKGSDYRFVQPLAGEGSKSREFHCIFPVKKIDHVSHDAIVGSNIQDVLVFEALQCLHSCTGWDGRGEAARCRITYFLHDATFEVVKDGVVLLKRCCSVPSMRDSSCQYPWNSTHGLTKLSPLDFQIGSTITIYSHRFKIIDATARTREYYDSIGCPLGTTGLDEGTDSCCGDRNDDDDGVDNEKKKQNKKVSQQKRITQYLFKGEYIGCRDRLRTLQWRDVVLKVWGWVEKDKEHVLLLYYVEDNSVEMFEFTDSKLNKTRKILSRNNFVEQVASVMRGPDNYTMNGDSSPYQPSDFIIGKQVTLSGRNILIYKASEDTCRWMIDNIDGVDDERMKEILVGDDPGKRHMSRKHAEEEDCTELITPVPDSGLDRLQFVAKFSGNPESKKKLTNADEERRFIIQVYCSDLSVSISEMVQHSGAQGVKFLIKQRVYRDFKLKRNLIQPREFSIGGFITIYSHTFEILDADRATLTFMAHYPEYFELADGREAVDLVQRALMNHNETSKASEEESLPDLLEQLLPDFTRAQLMSACILLMDRNSA